MLTFKSSSLLGLNEWFIHSFIHIHTRTQFLSYFRIWLSSYKENRLILNVIMKCLIFLITAWKKKKLYSSENFRESQMAVVGATWPAVHPSTTHVYLEFRSTQYQRIGRCVIFAMFLVKCASYLSSKIVVHNFTYLEKKLRLFRERSGFDMTMLNFITQYHLIKTV